MSIEYLPQEFYTPQLGRKNSILEVSRVLVGVAGGSAAGKTTLCERIKRDMEFDSDFDITIIPLDAFYKSVDKSKENIAEYNFDHPDALDFDLALQTITSLMSGKATKIPIYDFKTHSRSTDTLNVVPSQLIFFEGILALYDQKIRELMHYKIFIQCDDDIRLCRRIVRDVRDRGRTVEGVLYQYNRFVKRAFDDYIRPTMNYADIIVPGSRNNTVAISFIVNHLKNMNKQLEVLKAIMNNMHFFGDILYNVNSFIQPTKPSIESVMEILERSNDPFRKLLFPLDQDSKEIFLFAIKFLTQQKVFSEKQFYRSLKLIHKQGLLMIEKALTYSKISFNQITCLDIKSCFLEENNKINEEYLKGQQITEFVVFTLPFYFKQEKKLFNALCRYLKKTYPKAKILLVIIFSTLELITGITEEFHNIAYVANIFMIGRIDKFNLALQNCKEGRIIHQIIVLSIDKQVNTVFFKSEKILQKTQRFFNKRKEKQKKGTCGNEQEFEKTDASKKEKEYELSEKNIDKNLENSSNKESKE